MTTGRLMTTLSVLGLGFAVAGAAPVLAQNYTTAPPPPPAPPAATPTRGMPPPAAERQGTKPAIPPSTEMEHPSCPTQHFAKRAHIRAAERTVAEQMNDADAKWRMLRIATDYDEIAKRAEAAQLGHGIESISEHREHNDME